MQFSNARYRTSPTLAIVPSDECQNGRAMIGVFEVLSNSFAFCSADTLLWFSTFHKWTTLQEAGENFPTLSKEQLFAELEPLIEANFITCEDTSQALKQDRYLREWKLGLPTALFHFSVLKSSYYANEDTTSVQLEKMASTPVVPLTWNAAGPSLPLASPFELNTTGLLEVMAARRTNRTSQKLAMKKDDIGACLFAGLGITGFVDEVSGRLPLSMTPSGGARNPYEAFVFLKHVADAEPGLYHYDALTHGLERLENQPADLQVGHLLGDQDWVDDMAAVVILAAFMERTTWKYSNACAYRVICLEAGHIAQNAMLMATSLGLTACPTAALNHEKLNAVLGLGESLTQTAIYAFTLDKASAYPDQIIPNEHLSFAQIRSHQSAPTLELI